MRPALRRPLQLLQSTAGCSKVMSAGVSADPLLLCPSTHSYTLGGGGSQSSFEAALVPPAVGGMIGSGLQLQTRPRSGSGQSQAERWASCSEDAGKTQLLS